MSKVKDTKAPAATVSGKSAKTSKEEKADTATKKAVAKKDIVPSKVYANLSKTATSIEQKKFRSKARRAISKLSDAVITASLTKDKKGLPTAIKEFIAHYKKEYVTNDFEVASIYGGSNEQRKSDLGKALKLAKGKLARK